MLKFLDTTSKCHTIPMVVIVDYWTITFRLQYHMFYTVLLQCYDMGAKNNERPQHSVCKNALQ
jgi:hypothetical protein